MESASDVWSSVLEIMKKSLTPVAVTTWFDGSRVVDFCEDKVVIHVPSDFKKGIIEGRFIPVIQEALRELFASEFEVILLGETEMEKYNRPVIAARGPEKNEFTFENFIVGNSNKFAHAAAKAVAEEQTLDYNPLFIYGESGLGKTHLLNAIRHEIRLKHPEYNIVYLKGDTFTNELVSAIQSGRNMDFRTKYRGADLFLMDDVQFIAGKEFSQEEMFHTFNTLHEAGHQIVLTADRPPKEMLKLDDRLRTRFEMGLVVEVQPPDYETRMAIIRNKALQLDIILPDDVMIYIAENMTSNVRQIEGTVKKAKAHMQLMDGEITVSMMSRIMKDMFREKSAPTPDLIIEETAKYYDLSVEDLKGKSQTKGIALPRQIAMYEIRKMNYSLQEIASIFHRDHTTVLASIRKIEQEITKSESFAQTIKDITANINGRS